MSANGKYQSSLASHEGVAFETSTIEEDWKMLKHYLADVATCLNTKKVVY